MMNVNHFTAVHDNENNDTTFITANQMMPLMPHYNTAATTTTHEYIDSQSNTMFSINNNYHAPHITAAPVVKSHNPISVFTSPIGAVPPQQQQQRQQRQQQQQQITSLDISTTNMMMNAMEIDDYFAGNANMFNVYSPSSTTTNNSSIMMMDNAMSPISPISNGSIHPPSLDSFVAPQSSFHPHIMMDRMDPSLFPLPIPSMPHSMQPFQVQDDQHLMYPPPNPHVPSQPFMNTATNARRTMPRRHTVSTPYATHTLTTPTFKGKEPTHKPSEPPIIKSRKSSLKAKRHRSLGKIDTYASTTSPSSPPPIPDLLSAKLELWTHEQLLERVMELEKEREVVQASVPLNIDEIGHLNTTTSTGNKVRSASHTDTEVDEDNEEDEEEEPQICKWEGCSMELKSLDDLIQHVKTAHIGSGKANYYCNWKDCPRKQKPFTKRHKMHNHLRTHTGERPFVCQEPDCGKKFSRPDSLTTHAKIHSNIRPYLCQNPDCGKAYYHLRSLRKHERTHLQQDMSCSSSPPPLPVVHMPTSHPDDLQVTQSMKDGVFSDWGMSAQAAVFDVMNRENNAYL